MEKYICDINGTLLAESGIVHGALMAVAGSDTKNLKSAEGETPAPKQKENKNISKARRMRQILHLNENNDQYMESVEVPAISGNALRGICRRLLVEHSFDVLDTSIDEVFQDMPGHDKIAKDVWFSFCNGGLTPKGSAMNASNLKAYDEIASIPWLGLLGAVYYGHQFEGASSFGILYPLVKENVYLYKDELGLTEDIIGKLPSVSLLKTLPIMMNTRKANVRDNSGRDSSAAVAEANKNNPDSDLTSDKGSSEAMIYGSEYIPAGVQFISMNRCITNDINVVMAFKASLALFLETHRLIGGKSAAGFGRVRPSFGFDFDTQEAIDSYDRMLVENKDDLIRKIRMIATELKFTMKESAARGKKAKKEKEGE